MYLLIFFSVYIKQLNSQNNINKIREKIYMRLFFLIKKYNKFLYTYL
jgi:hypothetical protein